MLLDAYQRLVIALKFKRRASNLGPYVRSDVVYLRMFKDVPHVDMEMHLPEQGTKVKMRWIDKAQIASPVVMGVPTPGAEAAGLAWPRSRQPDAAGPACVAPGHGGGELVLRVPPGQAQAPLVDDPQPLLPDPGQQRERPDPADRLGRGGGIQGDDARLLLPLADARARPRSGPCEQLDAHIEAFLKSVSGIEINFEIADALGKLFRLGLARRDAQGRLRAVPIDQALVALDRHWDNTFRYA